MKNIFKRRKSPLIIAPTKFNFYDSGSCLNFISTESCTAIISDPKTVSAIERTMEHPSMKNRRIKVIGATENFANALRSNGYDIEVEGG